MSRKITIALAILFVVLVGLGIYSVRTSDRTLQLKDVKLQDKNIEINKLLLEKKHLNEDYEIEIESGNTNEQKLNELDQRNKELEQQVKDLQAKKEAEKKIAQKPSPEVKVAGESTDNETVTWNFLIANGFTREQTAGIMGNLQQEHNFKTDDVKGGLGIAQWIGARRSRLIAKGNHLDLNTQLHFLMEEFKTSENKAYSSIVNSKSVESATVAFQNKFERCGKCHQGKRVQYAMAILGRH